MNNVHPYYCTVAAGHTYVFADVKQYRLPVSFWQ